jgi:hypothetical protein
MSTVRDLVAHTAAAAARRKSSVEEAWNRYVEDALAGREIDPDAFAAFCIEHRLDPERWALEVEIREQRARAVARAALRPERERRAAFLRQEFRALDERFRARLEALTHEPRGPARERAELRLKIEAQERLEAPHRELVEADLAVTECGHAANRVVELDNALKQIRRDVFGGPAS